MFGVPVERLLQWTTALYLFSLALTTLCGVAFWRLSVLVANEKEGRLAQVREEAGAHVALARDEQDRVREQALRQAAEAEARARTAAEQAQEATTQAEKAAASARVANDKIAEAELRAAAAEERAREATAQTEKATASERIANDKIAEADTRAATAEERTRKAAVQTQQATESAQAANDKIAEAEARAAAAEERARAAEQRLTELTEKNKALQSAEQARQRITQDVNGKFAPRRLTDADARLLRTALSKVRTTVPEVSITRLGDMEAYLFSSDLMAAFEAAGIHVVANTIGQLTPPVYGIVVDQDQNSGVIAAALAGAGLQARIVPQGGRSVPQIVVGLKPSPL